jgi:hypothetical protein
MGKLAMALGGAVSLNLALDVSDSQARTCAEIKREVDAQATQLRSLRPQLKTEKDPERKKQLEHRLDQAQRLFQQYQAEWNRNKCGQKKKSQ